MTTLKRISGEWVVGVPVVLANGDSFVAPAVVSIDSSGNPAGTAQPGVAISAGSASDTSSFSSANLQVQGLSGGDTLTVTRSVDGTNYVTQSGIAQDYSVVSAISADGIYSYPGSGLIKYAKTGSASTPTVTLRAGS